MPAIIVEGKGINEWQMLRLRLNQLAGVEQEAD
jgi:hypothetical protein